MSERGITFSDVREVIERGEAVVVASLEEYNGLMDRLRPLRRPRNAERLPSALPGRPRGQELGRAAARGRVRLRSHARAWEGYWARRMGGMAETLGDQPDDKGSPLGTVILVGSLFALLAGTVAFAWHTWRMMDVEVGFDGMVIAAVGSAFGIVLGVVLMRLCYISSRRGYDDEVGKD